MLPRLRLFKSLNFHSTSIDHSPNLQQQPDYPTQRYLLSVSSRGHYFSGSQTQGPNSKVPTIQAALQHAANVFMGPGRPSPRVVLGSRTDSGVHTLDLSAHVDIPLVKPKKSSILPDDPISISINNFENGDFEEIEPYHPTIIHKALNSLLFNNYSGTLSIGNVVSVDDSVHARRSVSERIYTYRILLAAAPETTKQPFSNEYFWNYHSPNFNIDALIEATQHLVGKEIDFTSFRHSRCEAGSPIRKINFINVETFSHNLLPFAISNSNDLSEIKHPNSNHYPWNDPNFLNSEIPFFYPKEIRLTFSSKSWLYRQIRNLVGYLVSVGEGKIIPSDTPTYLTKCTRKGMPPPAPSSGLYLTRSLFHNRQYNLY